MSSIIVVNDDRTQLHLSLHLLRQAGHDALGFHAAAPMLTELGGAPVDLFIVDLHMPGIDGWKLCRLLRSPEFPGYNDTPILIASATFTGADVEAITSELGANAFLPIPHTREELLSFVDELLAGSRPRRRSSVLLVEDDPAVRRVVAREFEDHGYRVTEVDGVARAIAQVERRTFDAVVLDYHLPDGSCLPVLERCAAPTSATVTLIATGDPDAELAVELMSLGADGYLTKPFDPRFVVEVAEKARRERSLLRVESVLETRTQELRAAEDRRRRLFHTLPEPVLLLDQEWRVIECNGEAAEGLGVDAEEAVGRKLASFVHLPAAGEMDAAARRISQSGRAVFEARVGSGDTARHMEVVAAATEHAGRPALLVMARDISDRRRLEAERRDLEDRLQQSQRLESLGVMAGGIAHDFNNLLVGILGNAELALAEDDPQPSVREALVQIEAAARRAAELTDQILTFSGKGSVRPRDLDLSGLVRSMAPILASAVSDAAEIGYRLAPDLPPVEADAGLIRQVVMSLVVNASDALGDEEGMILLRTGTARLDASALKTALHAEAARPGDFVFLEVRDTGSGVDEATRERMFEPFFTTKGTGRGLGLAATLGVARAHAGALGVDSAPGRGTSVRIYLPTAGSARQTS